MSDVIKSALTRLIQGERPGPDSIRACFQKIMNGDVSEAQMGAFLIALKIRGEQVSDIAAAAAVMREKATTITASDATMDIVGTGGDGLGTYNISTASAFVVAGCGIPVAKHGNKAVSSQSGAADVYFINWSSATHLTGRCCDLRLMMRYRSQYRPAKCVAEDQFDVEKCIMMSLKNLSGSNTRVGSRQKPIRLISGC